MSVPLPRSGDSVADDSAPIGDLITHAPGQFALDRATEVRERGLADAGKGALGRWRPASSWETAWRQQARAEQLIGSRLNQLAKQGHAVLHSIELIEYATDVDHLVIGPTGVHCIETRQFPRQTLWLDGESATIDGTPTPLLREVRRQAGLVRRQLSKTVRWEVPVSAHLVVLDGRGQCRLIMGDLTQDIEVSTTQTINETIMAHPGVIGSDAVWELIDAARNPDVWSGRGITQSTACRTSDSPQVPAQQENRQESTAPQVPVALVEQQQRSQFEPGAFEASAAYDGPGSVKAS